MHCLGFSAWWFPLGASLHGLETSGRCDFSLNVEWSSYSPRALMRWARLNSRDTRLGFNVSVCLKSTTSWSPAVHRFLERLLLVHGRWDYRRTCKARSAVQQSECIEGLGAGWLTSDVAMVNQALMNAEAPCLFRRLVVRTDRFGLNVYPGLKTGRFAFRNAVCPSAFGSWYT